MRTNGSKRSLLQMRKLRPQKTKVNYPRSRNQSGSKPERNRAHSGRGCPTTSGLGLGQLSCPSHGSQVRSPVCCLGVSFTPEITATGSQKPPESTSYARHPDKGPKGARKKADAARGTHPRPGRGAQAAAQRQARAAPNMDSGRTSPRADTGARPGPRTLTRPRRCRRRPGMRKVGGAATPLRLRLQHRRARPARGPRRTQPSLVPPPGRVGPARSPHSSRGPEGSLLPAQHGEVELRAASAQPGSLRRPVEAPPPSPTTCRDSRALGALAQQSG